MKFSRNEKIMLFVFGSSNSARTISNLMSAGMLAGETPLRTQLWGLAERIWDEENDINDYAADYVGIRKELDVMFHAPVITYDQKKEVYLKTYPLLEGLTQYLFGCFMEDFVQDRLDFVIRLISNEQIKARMIALLDDWKDTGDTDIKMLGSMYEGHKQINQGIRWMFGEEDSDETDEV